MSAFAALFGALAVLRHRAFGSGRFDLGNMTQAVWSTANGDLLSVTDVHGEQISRLGSHFDPILVALAPLWWIWPSPELLLVVQAVAVAAGALPVFWLARAHLDSERSAAALALAYLLYPPVQWLTVSDFHPVSLAIPLLLFAWWFLDERRLLPFALCAAAALATKEHVGLTIAAMGIWYAIRYRAPRTGAAIAIAAGSVALLATSSSSRTSRLPASRRSRAATTRRRSTAATSRTSRRFLPARPAPVRGAARAAAGPARARTEPALEHVHPDLREDALRRDGDPRSAGGDRLRRRPDRRHAPGTSRRSQRSPALSRSARRPRRHRRRAARRCCRGGLSPSSPRERRSARRTRSAHTSPTGGGSSASPLLREADWVAVDSTRLTYLDSLRPGRARPALADCGVTRTGGSSSPRTASSSSGTLDRDRLRQQVRAEAERDQLRAAVVLGGRERHGPDRVPRRQPGRRREQQAPGEPEPTRPRAASRPSQRRPARAPPP